MFKLCVAAFLALASVVSANAIQARDTPSLFNGQNVTFEYSDSIASGSNLFGMGLLPTGIEIPEKVTDDGWVGPVILNIDNEDGIPATYVLQYAFFVNGLSYTARLFQYNTQTFEVVQPNVHNATFIWVNQPGQNV
ncbi:hypothetical protein C8R44DRAFT_980943 [Mycena epipterygia]|nr:hypothetical protein C8R44DRAFT_980943 [Mycena epipterygia]